MKDRLHNCLEQDALQHDNASRIDGRTVVSVMPTAVKEDYISQETAVETTDTCEYKYEAVEAPTPLLREYDAFVNWLLTVSMEELTSLSISLPFEMPQTETESPKHRFESTTHAVLARAEAETEWEVVADHLSIALREQYTLEEQQLSLQSETEEHKEQIALLESRIVKRLHDRDVAIAVKYTAEKQIAELERWKAEHPQTSQRSLLGFLKFSDRRSVTSPTNKDLEKLQKQIADTKLATALAKTELDTHYYRLRQIEKQCAVLKLEIAQASALEDDLQVNLAHLRRASASSLDKLQQVSLFSTISVQNHSPKR